MKYKLNPTRKTLSNNTPIFQIEALKDFNDVKKGDLGGFVQSEQNLSQTGNCWAYDNAWVINGGQLLDNAVAKNNSFISQNGIVKNSAVITEFAEVGGKAIVGGDTIVRGEVIVAGDATLLKGVFGGRKEILTNTKPKKVLFKQNK
jgi:hypothetical protein